MKDLKCVTCGNPVPMLTADRPRYGVKCNPAEPLCQGCAELRMQQSPLGFVPPKS